MPLSALLSWTWIAHVIEIDTAVEEATASCAGVHLAPSFAMWANGLRLIPEHGTTVAELRSSAGATCNLGGLERWGWIKVGEGGGRRDGYGSHRGIEPTSMLRPTEGGSYLRRLFPVVVGLIEERWRKRLGERLIDPLGGQLAGRGFSLPWSPPEVHASDGFLTHAAKPLAGADRPPLVVLLGQALTALTVGYERDASVSLPLAANFLRVLQAGPAAVNDLPVRTGVSREATAMALGWLKRQEMVAIDANRLVNLTAAGLRALSEYAVRGGRDDDAALRAALTVLLGQTGALAAGLEPPVGSWRSKAPYLAQTRRRLASPTEALPWQPMVLHRGGWPDGS